MIKRNNPTTTKSNPTILVLGGYGFIGRYTVAALQKTDANVLIGTRGNAQPVRAGLGVRQVRLEQSLDASQWSDTLHGVDAVINCVGIMRERHHQDRFESFDAVHHKAVKALASCCARQNIPLIHVSALGITQNVKNEFALSKLRGENALLASGCAGDIVRASVVDETDGYGSGWFHRLAQWPVWLMPAGAIKKLSPIKSADLGQALANLAMWHFKHEHNKPRVLEVSCGETFTLKSYLMRLRTDDNLCGAKPLLIIRIPRKVARAFATLFDWWHLTPYSIGHHELLEHDNLPAINHLPEILGRAPRRISPAMKALYTRKLTTKPGTAL